MLIVGFCSCFGGGVGWEEVGCQRKLVANGIISVGMDLSYLFLWLVFSWDLLGIKVQV